MASLEGVQAKPCVPYTDTSDGIATADVPRKLQLFHALEGNASPDHAVIFTAGVTASSGTPGKNAIVTLNNKFSGDGEVLRQLYFYELIFQVPRQPKQTLKYYLYYTDSCDIPVNIPGLDFQRGTMMVKIHQLTRIAN